VRARRGGRRPADAVANVGSGTISLYTFTSRFEAVCLDHEPRGRCRLTRSSVAGARPAQGRPLGLMTTWLLHSPMYASMEEHQSNLITLSFAHEDREKDREFLFRGIPQGEELARGERPRRAGEGAEPADAP
jgi:hypothetical protein